MIAVGNEVKRQRRDQELAQDLENKHGCAVDANVPWTGIWQLFHEHAWFKQRLNSSAQRLLKANGLPAQLKDDVTQEASLVFARSLRRDTSLGFDEQKGVYAAFLSTIVYRCCQKGVRQFRREWAAPFNEELAMFADDFTEELSDQLDLDACLDLLPEPYKLTVKLFREGKTIPQIAKRTKRCTRTIYRWLETATSLLRDAWDIE